MAENFTTFTEVDPDAEISVAASVITFTALDRNNDAYVYKDAGAAHFSGNFTHNVDINFSSVGSSSLTYVWALTNTVDDYKGIDDASGDALSLRVYGNLGTPKLILAQLNSGTEGSDSYNSFALSTDYYITITRDMGVGTYGTLYAYIYSDAGRTIPIDTLIETLAADVDFRYVFGLLNYNSSNSGATYEATGTVSNLDLTEAADSIDSIDSPVLDAEQNNAGTYSGMASGDPTSFIIKTAGSEYTSANLLDTATGGDFTWDMPDVAGFTVPTAMIPFDTTSWTPKTAELSNGTESATKTIVVNEKANWHVVEVDTPLTTFGKLFYVAGGWKFAAPTNTDQVYYYSTETVDDQADDYLVIAADGTITTNLLSGSVPFVFWDASNGIGYPDTIQLSAGTTVLRTPLYNVLKSVLRSKLR